jgi:hypothetical protein
MSARYGIDTSILERLVTGLPVADFEQTVQTLSNRFEIEGAQLHASAVVIGEAYIALQQHYGVSKPDARFGLMDRLIAHDYEESTLDVLTLDRKMARLPGAVRL